MDDTQSIIDILNELLAFEQCSLAPRLIECSVFVSSLTVEQYELVQRMSARTTEHGSWLVDVIIRLGGVPGLRIGSTASADLHYLDLPHAMPRLIADHEALIRKYKLAAERVVAEPLAAEMVGRILARHQDGHTTLLKLTGGNAVVSA
jgi:hypothetical protein